MYFGIRWRCPLSDILLMSHHLDTISTDIVSIDVTLHDEDREEGKHKNLLTMCAYMHKHILHKI